MNSEELEKFYANIYKLAYITRFSSMPRIRNESVAEHSFFVASLVVKLHEAYSFNLGTALEMAITHDWAEVFIGDITYATKLAFPNIAKSVHKAEQEAIKQFSTSVQTCITKYNEQDTVEAMVVKLADVMQVAQYAEHEVRLGNTGYMIDVANSAYKRLEQLKEKLYEHKRR